MRIPTALCIVLAWATTAADALTIDAKAMARFDISYTQCEAKFPDMVGRRDEAYLSLWRVKADEKTRAELAKVRKGTAYLSERRRILQARTPSAASAASSPLEQQCQALRAETQRASKAKP